MSSSFHCVAAEPSLSHCCAIFSGTLSNGYCHLSGVDSQSLSEQFTACATDSAVCREGAPPLEPRQRTTSTRPIRTSSAGPRRTPSARPGRTSSTRPGPTSSARPRQASSARPGRTSTSRARLTTSGAAASRSATPTSTRSAPSSETVTDPSAGQVIASGSSANLGSPASGSAIFSSSAARPVDQSVIVRTRTRPDGSAVTITSPIGQAVAHSPRVCRFSVLGLFVAAAVAILVN
ncbi:hypothetical protein A1Q2_05278 [Trichosporon asahii var. asahii CBS 8904]|uniref:Uncharacterized protein n=1 Tax=Trichosporon asahii var. asahii (strain CBS 8904) TaxID=1220162 RepID=K1VHX3_TRIAC|nr:hypothetical protein A1Q2_05278 [Trichosporon asahii var. asahii CBS 8904]